MQELIHGLREEQQQAQRALQLCQQALRANPSPNPTPTPTPKLEQVRWVRRAGK